MEKRTTLFENGLIWFGAAVSLAEILTGTYFAPMGLKRGISAILLGHVLGCVLLFLAGVIGGKMRRGAMETVKYSFGTAGGGFFAVMNVLQLIGWTAIMIYDGALAAEGIFAAGKAVWCLVIGALILLWILIGVKNLGKLNNVVMALLFVLTLILCGVIFFGENTARAATEEAMSFGAAVELAVAMPLSWLPLISDYTREAEKPVGASAVSAVTYFVASSFMYIIGMSAAYFTGESDIASIMLKAGLGTAGLVIVILSTVTTTFLDANSAGISCATLSERINGKHAAAAAAIVGTILAMIFPMDDITDFLYLIGSVFAPMIAVQIADFFILKEKSNDRGRHIRNMLIWAVGFVTYRVLMKADLPLGSTFVDMLITVMLCLIVSGVYKTVRKREEKE